MRAISALCGCWQPVIHAGRQADKAKQSKSSDLKTPGSILVHPGCYSHARLQGHCKQKRARYVVHAHNSIIRTRDRPARIGARPRTLAIGRRTDALADALADGAGDGITSRRARDSNGPGGAPLASLARPDPFVEGSTAQHRTVAHCYCTSCAQQGEPMTARDASHPGLLYLSCTVHRATTVRRASGLEALRTEG